MNYKPLKTPRMFLLFIKVLFVGLASLYLSNKAEKGQKNVKVQQVRSKVMASLFTVIKGATSPDK